MILESCSSAQPPVTLSLNVGVRVGIASSPMGWALLAALPELERYYLLEHVQRRMPREWSRLRRRSSEGIAQVHQNGWCASVGERDQAVGTIAVPLLIPDQTPMVLACIGSSARMTRARVERELAPRLVAMATAIQEACSSVPT
jgi:DNA-binding IclR family transcriptional regulator